MIGKTLGPYILTEALGAGGMGEVYRAHDERLDREVAIKVLPQGLAGDAAAMARFEAEAKAIAALSHPNIVGIFDVGHEGDTAYVVTELLEGDTLGDLLLEGPLPYRKASDYAREIALGLAAAHDKGIVHRDVKPANIFVTRDGRVKLLDFGLAKSSSLLSGKPGESVQATVVGTEPGTILGTVGYMAPEQIRGEVADARSDIFALGAVLFEMLNGKPAFRRDTSAETMTAILREEPPQPTSGDRPLPRSLERVVRHCLEKRPEDRFQTARDLAFAVDNASVASGSDIRVPDPAAIPSATRRSARTNWLAIGGVALVAAAAGLLAGRALVPAAVPVEPARLQQITFSGTDTDPAASPDGLTVAFGSMREGGTGIWIKQLSTGGERQITAGNDARPRFSPDGQSLLFTRLTGDTLDLHRTTLVGGQARRLVDNATEGDWSADGEQVVFVRSDSLSSSLWLLDLESSQETMLIDGTVGFVLETPRFSPEGSRVVVTRLPITNAAGGGQQLIVDVGGGEVTEVPMVTDSGATTGATWTASGDALVYGVSPNATGDRTGVPGRVLRQDLATGEARTLFWVDGLFPQRGDSSGFGVIDRVGTSGLVLGITRVEQRLHEMDLERDAPGSRGRALTAGAAQDRQPTYSPDGRKILFSSNRSGNLDLWLLDRETLVLTQVTDDTAQDWDPAFSPDGRQILWSSDRSGNLQIWLSDVDGNAARQVTAGLVDAQNPTLTADERWIIYVSADASGLGVHRVRPDGSEDELIYTGALGIVESAPTRAWAAFSQIPGATPQVRVLDMDTGSLLDLGPGIRIPLTLTAASTTGGLTMGRPRWLPGSETVAFVSHGGNDLTGIYTQDIRPGVDTTSTRRLLGGGIQGELAESFGISPDGRFLVIALQRNSHSLVIASNVSGIE